LWLEVTAARAAEFFRIIRERIAAELDKLTAGRFITSCRSTVSSAGVSTTITTIRPGLTANNGLESYCGYAKRRLKAYHGGFKRAFRLFIRE
jgi:hypothetical protein